MAAPTKRFKVPSNSSYPSATIEITQFVPPMDKVYLTTKQVHYSPDDQNIYMKDQPINRIYRTKITQVTDGEFEIGDLVWSQDGQSPYWPGIIAADPASGHYHKKGSDEDNDMYFIEYFGREPTLGWNTSENVISFHGYHRVVGQICRYHRRAEQEYSSIKEVSVASFRVSQEEWPAWNYAIAEAQEAMKLGQNQRIDKLSFDYLWHGEPRASAKVMPLWYRDCTSDNSCLNFENLIHFCAPKQANQSGLEMNDNTSDNSEINKFFQPPFDPEEDRGSKLFEREILMTDVEPWAAKYVVALEKDVDLKLTVREMKKKYADALRLNLALKKDSKAAATSSGASATTTEQANASQAVQFTSASAVPEESTPNAATTEEKMLMKEFVMSLGTELSGGYFDIAATTENEPTDYPLQVSLQAAAGDKDEPMEADDTSDKGDTQM